MFTGRVSIARFTLKRSIVPKWVNRYLTGNVVGDYQKVPRLIDLKVCWVLPTRHPCIHQFKLTCASVNPKTDNVSGGVELQRKERPVSDGR